MVCPDSLGGCGATCTAQIVARADGKHVVVNRAILTCNLSHNSVEMRPVRFGHTKKDTQKEVFFLKLQHYHNEVSNTSLDIKDDRPN